MDRQQWLRELREGDLVQVRPGPGIEGGARRFVCWNVFGAVNEDPATGKRWNTHQALLEPPKSEGGEA